jgi:hypothetical protein
MNDKALLETAIMYGKNALEWRKKFIGLLPEINKRKLYEQKNCTSIFEFGAKFGGLSQEHVSRAINLEKRLEELPKLHEVLVNGEVSMNKLVRVVSIATKENEEKLVEAVKILPNRSVETLVRDQKPTVHVHKLELSEEVKLRLTELQEKGIDVNELILSALNKREEEIEEAKAEPTPPAISRHIPMKIQRLIKKEYGSKCSISTCKRPSTEIHHTQTFAISHKHDPNYLAPLCKEHHTIAHSINLKVREMRLNYYTKLK